MGLLVCTKCQQSKPATTEWFPPHNRKKNGLDSWCRKCRANYRNSINRGKFRAVMSDAELIAFKASRTRCDICSEPAPLVVDHCHSTGKVRGMLCQHCNRGLGHFRDKPAVMAKAIEYLKEAGHAA